MNEFQNAIFFPSELLVFACFCVIVLGNWCFLSQFMYNASCTYKFFYFSVYTFETIYSISP